MQILFKELSIIEVKKDEIFCVDFNVEAIFRLFKFLKKDKNLRKKYNHV